MIESSPPNHPDCLDKTAATLDDIAVIRREIDTKLEKAARVVEGLGTYVDGMSKTAGLEAEEFFFSSLTKRPMLGGVEFDIVRANVDSQKRGERHEIDIMLENEDTIGIVEVKVRVKRDSIMQLQKIVDNFCRFHPCFTTHKIIAALAGKVFPKHLQEEALKHGFVVLTQQGNHVEQRVAW